ncbi:N-acetyltransferase [Rhodophyticola sp. CCM32]|uniref:GNAT family N-acetyltransferase n=1 Tax=Rhodophyticola sp. CCM32 TaxID=2916397 RepID=UPI00107F435E|nr:GNAT family protein [Rhodophyticola sp. CCM32]QBY01089.1 N-acetyltransferase [Rhodophyticola sp. CCM32]
MAGQDSAGPLVTGFQPPPVPDGASLAGRYARLVRLRADDHAADLHRANSVSDAIWDYLPYGPFSSAAAYHRWVREMEAGPDPIFYAIENLETGQLSGVASYLRITPEMGTIEVGHINFAPELQRSRAATEAMYLMMAWAFEAGYRRYEWKCNARNLGSRRAAERLGFSYEGVFRQAAIVKGRNRDTAWFACIDAEWPALKEAFQAWLAPGNFDAGGQQKERLADLTRLVRVSSDPALSGR